MDFTLTLSAWQVVAIVSCGFIAGLINTIAGGGSLITVPLYLYLGIPPTFTNYVNRIPILSQSVAATVTYATTKKLKWKNVMMYVLPIIGGATIGAILAVDITERTVNRVLLAILCFVIISLIADLLEKRERRTVRLQQLFRSRPSYWITLPILFAVGMYGGFIQIGVGLVIYPIIHIVCKRHYLTAMIVKVLSIAFVSILSLAIFWSRLTPALIYAGLITAAGSMAGSIVGAAITIGPYGKTIVRVFLIAISIAGILRLLFVV